MKFMGIVLAAVISSMLLVAYEPPSTAEAAEFVLPTDTETIDGRGFKVYYTMPMYSEHQTIFRSRNLFRR